MNKMLLFLIVFSMVMHSAKPAVEIGNHRKKGQTQPITEQPKKPIDKCVRQCPKTIQGNFSTTIEKKEAELQKLKSQSTLSTTDIKTAKELISWLHEYAQDFIAECQTCLIADCDINIKKLFNNAVSSALKDLENLAKKKKLTPLDIGSALNYIGTVQFYVEKIGGKCSK